MIGSESSSSSSSSSLRNVNRSSTASSSQPAQQPRDPNERLVKALSQSTTWLRAILAELLSLYKADRPRVPMIAAFSASLYFLLATKMAVWRKLLGSFIPICMCLVGYIFDDAMDVDDDVHDHTDRPMAQHQVSKFVRFITAAPFLQLGMMASAIFGIGKMGYLLLFLIPIVGYPFVDRFSKTASRALLAFLCSSAFLFVGLADRRPLLATPGFTIFMVMLPTFYGLDQLLHYSVAGMNFDPMIVSGGQKTVTAIVWAALSSSAIFLLCFNIGLPISFGQAIASPKLFSIHIIAGLSFIAFRVAALYSKKTTDFAELRTQLHLALAITLCLSVIWC
eukprot:TRINITY_DN3958_c0_g1_i1.p1 TRINITY_DN3958_c0_g1~~TRINITY_DN3958_c0_g1_i1.p1  ORF type:complete len:336 (+),score=76.19 TRINITY_DN3958_c0_g1_i1:1264-2271(+)